MLRPVCPMLLITWILVASSSWAAQTIQFVHPPSTPPLDILSANVIGYFNVTNDADAYDGLPHQRYWFCLRPVGTGTCDSISFTEYLGSPRPVLLFEEALLPYRGQQVDLRIKAFNQQTQDWDDSPTYTMRVAPSNIALSPPGLTDIAPWKDVYPTRTSGITSLATFSFRWPRTTTGLGGIWGGMNTGAHTHLLSVLLRESAGSHFGLQRTFVIDVERLTGDYQSVGMAPNVGVARLVDVDGFTHVEFRPDPEIVEVMTSEVSADTVIWRVGTCVDVPGAAYTETCGKSENIAHVGFGTIGLSADPGGGGGLPTPGTAFGDSPLLETFAHPACIGCHVMVPQAEAGEGRGAAHLPLITAVGGAPSQDPIHLTNPNYCVNCHDSGKAPQILGTAYASAHGLPGTYASWWAWFAPEYTGSLTWPDHLKDSASPDYDPATACSLFTQATPDAASMKHHLFEDPRVVWSIVGGAKPNNNIIAELAPPGDGLDPSNLSLGQQEAVLATWEEWVNDWVDGGMNCGTTSSGTSVGGGSNEDVNTTPPTTTSDGSSGTWVGGAPGSGDTTIAHLDCQPDVDSDSTSCAWTFFACGSNATAVQNLIQACDEDSATFYKPPQVPSPAGLCDQPVSNACYKIDPGDGSSGYHSIVQIPAEIGDTTTLAFFSIDVEGNQEAPRSEVYTFVEADLQAPRSGVELVWDEVDEEHELRFSCKDNSDTCMIFYTSNDPGEDSTPQFNFTAQLLNSGGGAANSDGNVLGYLKTDRVQRIRWAAIDGAAGQKNVEFDRLCEQDALDLCPGKLAEQNACIATCEDDLRIACEASCAGDESEYDCVSLCVADGAASCTSSCAQSCEPTFTGCPGTGGSTGVPLDRSCNSRTSPIQCYHEFVYDPDVYSDGDPPEASWSANRTPRSDGTYEEAFRLDLLCADPVNECQIFYTTDGSQPTADLRMLYTDALIIPASTTGRTATTTVKFFSQDSAVPPNASPVQSLTLTVALPHTDDDGDGYSEDDGDCNDADDQVYPGAAEVCDGIDNNCAGGIDEGLFCTSDQIFADGFESGDSAAWLP